MRQHAPPRASAVSFSRALIPFGTCRQRGGGRRELHVHRGRTRARGVAQRKDCKFFLPRRARHAAHWQCVARHWRAHSAIYWAESCHPGTRHERSNSDHAQLAAEESRHRRIARGHRAHRVPEHGHHQCTRSRVAPPQLLPQSLLSVQGSSSTVRWMPADTSLCLLCLLEGTLVALRTAEVAGASFGRRGAFDGHA
jgi:hypothetical protein